MAQPITDLPQSVSEKIMPTQNGCWLWTAASSPHGNARYGRIQRGGVCRCEVMRDEDLPGNAARIGRFLMDQLREMQREFPVIGDVRGMGLMIGVEFVTADGGPNGAAAQEVIRRAQERRTLLISAGTSDQVVRVIPPLVVTQQQAEEFLDVFADSVKDVS